MQERYGSKQQPKSLDEIERAARRGMASYVDDAVLNGDLDDYPESFQRKLVAGAHDNVVGNILNFKVPMNPERESVYDNIVQRNLQFAVKVFFKADGKSLKDEILEFRLEVRS